MSEFEPYLTRLREHLDVSSTRAEEIVAETYSHLEEHARQLMESGLSREEAVRTAEQTMGDPATLAADITRANSRHRAPSALRVPAATAVVFATWLALDPAGNLWASGAAPWLARHAALSVASANILFQALGLGCSALLGGGVAGRRYWWIVLTPVVLTILVVWGSSLLRGHLVYAEPGRQALEGLVYPLAAAVWMGAIAYGASRPKAPPAARRTIGSAMAVLLAAASVAGVIQEVTLAQSAFCALVIAEGATVLLLLAIYAERTIAERQLLAWLLLTCGASALALGATAALLPVSHATSGTIYGALVALAATAALAAVVGALKVREAAQRRPHAQ